MKELWLKTMNSKKQQGQQMTSGLREDGSQDIYFQLFEKHDLMLVQNSEQMQAMQEQLSMMYQVFTEGKAKQTDKLAEAIENPYGPKKIEETTQEESSSRSEKAGLHNTRSTRNDRHKNSLGESVDSNRGGIAVTVPKHSAQRKMRASTEQEKDLLGKLRRAPRTTRDIKAPKVTGSDLAGPKTNQSRQREQATRKLMSKA
jgi:hypothetical protein